MDWDMLRERERLDAEAGLAPVPPLSVVAVVSQNTQIVSGLVLSIPFTRGAGQGRAGWQRGPARPASLHSKSRPCPAGGSEAR